MDLEEIKTTSVWQDYERGRSYMRLFKMFSDTDRNNRMYSGNQWEGAKVEGIEQAQYNFIETIVNYKTTAINQNLYAINFSSENFETREFRKVAEKVCKMLNKKASRVWEKDSMDNKVRDISDDSAINDEGVVYIRYDEETQSPINEVLDKTDIQYGNEQSDEIQSQPYIIISRRRPIVDVQEMARNEGISEEKLQYIVGDTDTHEQAGDDAKIEKDNMCTVVTKMWKEKGTVHFSMATKFLTIKERRDTGLHLYPVAHFVWKKKKGSARGEGEVRTLIPNQLELNKTLARMLLSIKQCAYAQKVADVSKISNPDAINQVGGLIKTRGTNVDDVSKIFTYVQPTSMSTDVSKLINDLITITRELKNSSEIATGAINPEDASGRAILAIQQASKEPLTKQALGLKRCLEDIARIWLDMWTVYTPEGLMLEEEITDTQTGEVFSQLVKVPAVVLENLKGTVKIDITPKGAFDKYARELSLENMLKAGYFNAQRVGELRKYAEALPEDATMPKQDLLDICDKIDEEQRKIAEIKSQGQILKQKAMQFLYNDPTTQAEQISEAEQLANIQAIREQNLAQATA